MFTGIIEEVGMVAAVEDQGDALRLTVKAATVLEGTRRGDSISVDGVCLTAADLREHAFCADVMRESLTRSNLGNLEVGSRVNLERAMAVGEHLGGHIVQGHVDATAALLGREHSEHWDVLRYALPSSVARYVVEKGSIALNGTSLTVSGLGKGWFEVSLIPTTLRDTTHGDLVPGDLVNVEVDVLAKYVERLLAPGAGAAAREG
ncbi:riboflavin synthase [Corynebacterium sp. zg-331]|uniref:riboflavin synthase n=1 Tax=unclassified Corynebacterium TaxID=2624378 RepID=UPI00128DD314|nr:MULTISPECIES: riboflavin synthase [unclassified Corynebacterium]MBC3185494.1 riboflavin synthase [Corynebacterium sp. zg-331]MPV51988.1 riboflavin synthase [Corynebacterium sp. zg331]